MSTLKATNLQHASATSPNITLGSDGSVAVGGGNISPQTGFKNRIINGDMRIDQRNAGASVTNASSGTVLYTLDRFGYAAQSAGKFTIQQNAGSVTPPTGFTNYLGITSSAATTIGSSDYYVLSHKIEGLNIADFGWGTSGASAITLSFWVRSSLTGSFPFVIRNSASNRGYAQLYTISSANTWEYKTITIPGDTTGAWLTTNGIGAELLWSIGTGSTFNTSTTGSWIATGPLGVTGQVNLLATNGATFYITGVQLEKGSVATPYEFRSIGQETQLCQRYAHITRAAGDFNIFGSGVVINATEAFIYIAFPVPMRASPSATPSNISQFMVATGATNQTVTSLINRVRADFSSTNINPTVGGGLTTSNGAVLINAASTTPSILFSAEL